MRGLKEILTAEEAAAATKNAIENRNSTIEKDIQKFVEIDCNDRIHKAIKCGFYQTEILFLLNEPTHAIPNDVLFLPKLGYLELIHGGERKHFQNGVLDYLLRLGFGASIKMEEGPDGYYYFVLKISWGKI